MNMKTAIASVWMLTTKTLQRGILPQFNHLGKFKRGFLAVLAVGLTTTAFSQDNTIIEISGQVVNQEKKEPLPDVSVQIKGALSGTVTDNTGSFVLRTKQKLPFTLIFSSIGFQQQELVVSSMGSKLQIAMVTQTVLGNEVVVTASRVPENILK